MPLVFNSESIEYNTELFINVLFIIIILICQILIKYWYPDDVS